MTRQHFPFAEHRTMEDEVKKRGPKERPWTKSDRARLVAEALTGVNMLVVAKRLGRGRRKVVVAWERWATPIQRLTRKRAASAARGAAQVNWSGPLLKQLIEVGVSGRPWAALAEPLGRSDKALSMAWSKKATPAQKAIRAEAILAREAAKPVKQRTERNRELRAARTTSKASRKKMGRNLCWVGELLADLMRRAVTGEAFEAIGASYGRSGTAASAVWHKHATVSDHVARERSIAGRRSDSRTVREGFSAKQRIVDAAEAPLRAPSRESHGMMFGIDPRAAADRGTPRRPLWA